MGAEVLYVMMRKVVMDSGAKYMACEGMPDP